MSRYPVLFTDVELSEDYLLSFTKNDPDLCKYYDLIVNYLSIDPEDGEYYRTSYENMHDVLPAYMVGFCACLQMSEEDYINDAGVNTTRDLHRWFFTFLKKFLKLSDVWFASVAFDFVPTDSNDLKIIEIDINDRLEKIDSMDHFKIKNDVYYRFVDKESQ